MNGFESLAFGAELNVIRKERSKKYLSIKIPLKQLDKYISEGWTLAKRMKTRLEMQKEKPLEEQFSDQVWLLMNKLGFTSENREKSFCFHFDIEGKKQNAIFDVIAIDDEIALVIKCKVANDEGTKGNVKNDLDSFAKVKPLIISSIRNIYPDRKVKIILATKNIIINKIDQEKLKEADIAYFNEDTIAYYEELGEHLGASSKFQLLGSLFPSQRILNMVNTVPAIEGKMGGQKYYAFSIEPEKLLKIGYVLHRNNANDFLMPTYQRIIKKPRLQAVQAFIEHGGYFPNSIVISIDTQGKGLQFDLSSLQADNALSRIGILHLPQTYRAAYIIDGQHRLYGYSNTKYEKTNCIPVVAFVDLPKEQQIRLFMEINENQKSVSKNLRLTLLSDILWDSKSLNKRREALRTHVAQRLGLNRTSPLYKKVIVGENNKTENCFITIDTIQSAINACDFLSRFSSKNELKSEGTFDRFDIDATYECFYEFLESSIGFMRDLMNDEWQKADEKKSIVLTNNGIWALLKVFNDIINHIINEKEIVVKEKKTEEIVCLMQPYLETLASYIRNLTEEQRTELKRQYGSGGKASCWHDFQKAIHEKHVNFLPSSLAEYLKRQEMQYNEESFKMIRDIELYLKNDFRQKLHQKFGENWLALGCPKQVYDEVTKLKSDKEYEAKVNGIYEPIDYWDCMTLINYRAIATNKSNWIDLFDEKYTLPDEKKKQGGKEGKTEWMVRLNTIRNKNFHTYSVSEDEYKFIKHIYDWLILTQNNK